MTDRPAPQVSGVMSVHNDAGRVSRAVESIIAQTFTDWELIVIDDGSTDGTADVLDRLAAGEPRMRVIHQENTGLTRALIRGCAEARGAFIARQDADDVSLPERLDRQVALLTSDPAIGFVSCATDYVGPQDEHLQTLRRPADPIEATRGLLEDRQGPPAHGSVMFRKVLYDEVGGYRPEFYFGQDSDLWLRMAERAQVAYCPEVLYAARREPQSVSGSLRSYQRRFGELGQACRQARQEGRSEQPILDEAGRLCDDVRAARSGGLTRASDASQMEYLIGSQLATNGDRRAAGYLWQVIRRRPWHWRAWVRLVQSRLPRSASVAGGGSVD